MDLAVLMGMCFVVDVLLLVVSGRLGGSDADLFSLLLGGLIGALYSGICTQSWGVAISGMFWRVLVLVITGTAVFGIGKNAICSVACFALINMGMILLTQSLVGKHGGLVTIIMFALLIVILPLHKNRNNRGTVPVEFKYAGKTLRVIALRDTGNMLCDPVTGDGVVIVGASVAKSLLGLDRNHLKDPVNTMLAGLVPGLRMIPYKTIGGTGFLLAIRMEGVKIGNVKSNQLVAFAPEGLGADCKYQALTGGTV